MESQAAQSPNNIDSLADELRESSLESTKVENDGGESRSSSESEDIDTTNVLHLELMREVYLKVVTPKGQMAEKLKKAAPYNVFLTTVTSAIETHSDPLSVNFQELLDPSLGELESSVQFSFMVNPFWLITHYYYAGCLTQPLLIMYGITNGEDIGYLKNINEKHPNITSIEVKIETAIGCYHPKVMIMLYKDKSMRLIISTSNLYPGDWDERVEGVWISDRLPLLAEGVQPEGNGESVTGFREQFLEFLNFHNRPELQPVIARVSNTDFRSVKVFLISSVPGQHPIPGVGNKYGHPQVAKLLSTHSAPIDDTVPINLQSSSIGFFGEHPSIYLEGEILSSFRRHCGFQPSWRSINPPIKMIYPSIKNAEAAYAGSRHCLMYDVKVRENQLWFDRYLYQWKSSSRGRTLAMPHIKTYCRYSDTGMYWFILTSGNMSRSAWGSLNPYKRTLRLNSYELGLVFFPRVMLGKDQFPMTEEQRTDETPVFKLPYDDPPVPYGKDDLPPTYNQEPDESLTSK